MNLTAIPMSVETDDTALLSLCQNRATRNEGFKLVLNKYNQPVYYFLRKIGLTHEAADELLQDIFVRFWKSAYMEHATLKIILYRPAAADGLAYLQKQPRCFAGICPDSTNHPGFENAGRI
ncbi:hypothetical protein HK413_13475 [Mucilaginibacter sp. S1162]|uniref:RNA polymerase sigma-70 region 2 domain-containing protein n=1 Tax=Mucilaginibacter humi TaxID=2732510 RepID=A0ABX1W3L0_9SPHI|nr:hypothetical protein [Mucilaginibacter humi]NNU34811.1 hypothetical protein [Mucilaginibacter humi]